MRWEIFPLDGCGVEQERRAGPRGATEFSGSGALYRRLVDALIPAALLGTGPDRRRRGRTLVAALLVQLGLCLGALTTVVVVLPAAQLRAAAGALLAAMLPLLAVPTALDRGRLVLATNALLGSGYAVVLTGFVLIGGMQVPLLHWLALLPMLAVLMGTPRSAAVWAGLCLATVSVTAWVGSLPSAFDRTGALGATPLVLDATVWIAVWAVFALVYEHRQEVMAEELGARNERLRQEVLQRRKSEARVRHLAYFDALTRLPNREYFKDQLRDAMRVAEIEGRQVGVLFLDLDGFKEINDRHGHEMGDLLLQHVARRLSNCVRAADSVSRGRGSGAGCSPSGAVVSRRGGDEFTVLLANIRGHEEAAVVARRIHGALRRPIDLQGHEVSISASIGIAMYPSDVTDLDALLRNADLAMYHAKERGKNNFQFFDESLNDAAQRRAALAGDLRVALEGSGLRLVYQPILDAGTREFVGMEALLRWDHPTRGELSPGEFIEVAEEFGLITQLGDFVLAEACRQWRRWRDAGLPALCMSINVSGGQLKQREFAARVAEALQAAAMPPKSLELEITENAVMEDEEEASRSLDAAKSLGVRVALDDFGTGYSSLSYVKRFPVDSIKIDRSFVGEVEHDPEARAITSAIVALAHELDLTVVAEGVETEGQDRYLSSLRCDLLQGFLFASPLTPEALENFLRENGLAHPLEGSS